ncbi:MAG: hypothetical protein ACOYMF_16835 [Bacteroidales bacterium]
MLHGKLKISLLSKILLIVFVCILSFVPDSFSRTGMKMYSIGNNAPWNSASSWSSSFNGVSTGLIPQSNDTLVIVSSVIQNVNFTFSGTGLLEVANTGVLHGDNLNLSFSGSAILKCDGEIKTSNLSIVENASLMVGDNGIITVKNTFINNSANNHFVTGKLIVTGSFSIGQLAKLAGNGIIEAAHYEGNGTVLGVSPAGIIPDCSLITEANWIGNIDNNWNEPLNWANGTIPASNSNIAVLISSHNPEINEIANCNQLYVNSGSVLAVQPTAVLEISGNLSVMGSGRLLLKSNSIKKASLILNGEVTGKVQSEYQIVAGQKYLLSSPVDMALSSTFLNMYLRTYNEPTSSWGEYIVPTNNPLQVMQGYELYSLSNDTRIFEGTPNHNSKSFAISNTGNGLNLTGNPYPCYIDWENNDKSAWQRNTIAAAIYYPDPSGSGNFSVYLPGGDDAVSLNNGSRYLAPMQGFFVKAAVQQGSLTVNENSRVSSLNDSRIVLKNNSIKFKLNDSDGLTDETLFREIANSTTSFDNTLDAYKLTGNTAAPSLYLSSDDDTKYAVSSIPVVNSLVNIPLNIECSKSGMFSLSASGCFNFESGIPVILEDKELNKFIDLRVDSVYSFYHSPEMDSRRFEIQFKSTAGIVEQGGVSADISVFPGEVRISGSERDVYTANLFTTDGKLIGTSKGILSEGIELSTGSHPNMICILQLSNGENNITKKILSK